MAMLLSRRLPLLRLTRPLQAASAPYTSAASGPIPPLQRPPVTTSSSATLGSRLGFPNATPLASARGDSVSSSSFAAYLTIGAAAALAAMPVAYADANEQVWVNFALPMSEHSLLTFGAGLGRLELGLSRARAQSKKKRGLMPWRGRIWLAKRGRG
jgi:hypothetical protein